MILKNVLIVKSLCLLLYILPGWKILDLMWENPIHLRGTIIKGRIQENNSYRQFMVVIDTKGEIKTLGADPHDVFLEDSVIATIRTLFAAASKEELMHGLERLGLNRERVELGRFSNMVCYVIGDTPGMQFWIQKDELLPIRVRTKNYDITFKHYGKFENIIFPEIIGVENNKKEQRLLHLDEISFLKTGN